MVRVIIMVKRTTKSPLRKAPVVPQACGAALFPTLSVSQGTHLTPSVRQEFWETIAVPSPSAPSEKELYR